MSKTIINWLEDASRVVTCHRNVPGMAVETLLATIVPHGSTWCVILDGVETIHSDFQKAKKFVEQAVDGKVIDAWD